MGQQRLPQKLKLLVRDTLCPMPFANKSKKITPWKRMEEEEKTENIYII
jgi:hypothetical protein